MKINKIAIIGLGYVGAPLMHSLLINKFNCVGFDKSEIRIKQLQHGIDVTKEIDKNKVSLFKDKISYDSIVLKDCDIFIVTVPTPITKRKLPNISFVKNATKIAARYMTKNSTFILESTVYPGLTEEICLPIIEKITKLKCNYKKDIGGFHIGYSPERVNPGDKDHRIDNTIKIISASSLYGLKKIEYIYSKVTKNNLHISPSIKVAEAAKIIENIQRDLNIALMNELHKLFNKMEIDTKEVLKAANTKWNFHNFVPGLVGGHCISVDPYYLTFKAKKLQFNPKVILAGRDTNDSMPIFYAKKIKSVIEKKLGKSKKIKLLLCGITFKKNVPDIRNSKSIDLSRILLKYGYKLSVFDPIFSKNDTETRIPLDFKNKLLSNEKFDCIVFCVDHNFFKNKGISFFKKHLYSKNSIIIDLVNTF